MAERKEASRPGTGVAAAAAAASALSARPFGSLSRPRAPSSPYSTSTFEQVQLALTMRMQRRIARRGDETRGRLRSRALGSRAAADRELIERCRMYRIIERRRAFPCTGSPARVGKMQPARQLCRPLIRRRRRGPFHISRPGSLFRGRPRTNLRANFAKLNAFCARRAHCLSCALVFSHAFAGARSVAMLRGGFEF